MGMNTVKDISAVDLVLAMAPAALAGIVFVGLCAALFLLLNKLMVKPEDGDSERTASAGKKPAKKDARVPAPQPTEPVFTMSDPSSAAAVVVNNMESPVNEDAILKQEAEARQSQTGLAPQDSLVDALSEMDYTEVAQAKVDVSVDVDAQHPGMQLTPA